MDRTFQKPWELQRSRSMMHYNKCVCLLIRNGVVIVDLISHNKTNLESLLVSENTHEIIIKHVSLVCHLILFLLSRERWWTLHYKLSGSWACAIQTVTIRTVMACTPSHCSFASSLRRFTVLRGGGSQYLACPPLWLVGRSYMCPPVWYPPYLFMYFLLA